MGDWPHLAAVEVAQAARNVQSYLLAVPVPPEPPVAVAGDCMPQIATLSDAKSQPLKFKVQITTDIPGPLQGQITSPMENGVAHCRLFKRCVAL